MDSKKALSLSPALSGNPLGGGKKTTAVRAIVSAQLSRTTQASQRRRARNVADRLETSLCSGLSPHPLPLPLGSFHGVTAASLPRSEPRVYFFSSLFAAPLAMGRGITGRLCVYNPGRPPFQYEKGHFCRLPAPRHSTAGDDKFFFPTPLAACKLCHEMQWRPSTAPQAAGAPLRLVLYDPPPVILGGGSLHPLSGLRLSPQNPRELLRHS